MTHAIPNSVIGAVSSVLAEHYQSHSKLNVLFMSAGALGEPPEGNMETKCSAWLKWCNDIADDQRRILESLARNQLSYQLNGFITL